MWVLFSEEYYTVGKVSILDCLDRGNRFIVEQYCTAPWGSSQFSCVNLSWQHIVESSVLAALELKKMMNPHCIDTLYCLDTGCLVI
jgi:hypothetical protein